MNQQELERMKKTRRESNKVFKFGESVYMSKGIIEIPVIMKGRKFYLRTEIVQGDVPWLMGKRTMSRMGMTIDLKRDSVQIEVLGGLAVKLREDEQGHLRLPIYRREKEELLLEGWKGKSLKEVRGAIMKLHLQFGHGSGEKIWKLTETAQWSDGLNEDERGEVKKLVSELIGSCEVCKRYKRNPAKPVVSFPWSKTFNEILALDVGEIEERKFLVIVDMATRYCQAHWIRDKKPETIIRALYEGWFAIFGAPAKILSDNGGEFQNEKVRMMAEKWNIKLLATAAESPWSNGLCEKTVGILKESLRKMRDDEKVDLTVALRWVVSARNSLTNNGGFSPNQLVFGKNPSLPNLMGEESSSPASRERGLEASIVRDALDAMHKAREVFIKNEACNKIRIALNKKVREHKLEEAVVGDEVFYKRENEYEWRGPAQVVGVSGKTVVVKHGNSLREIARVHITRIQGRSQEKEVENDSWSSERGVARGKESMATTGEMVNMEEKDNMVIGYRRREGEGNSEDSEEEEDSEGESEVGEREGNSEDSEVGEREEGLPKFRKGDRVRALNRNTGLREEWAIASLAGKRSSKCWADSYNVKDLESGDKGWVNLRDYYNVEKIEDEEEILLGFEDKSIVEAKEKELQSWRENDVYEEVEDIGQKAITTRWIVTEKVKEGKKLCKARLVARGFEEEMAEWEKDAPTCNAETLKFCLAIMKFKKWNCYTLDVKTAYLQGDDIQRDVYLKPPGEGDWNGLWKLKKTVYGLKDAAKAWYVKVVKVVEELRGVRSRLEPNIFFWREGEDIQGVLCTHVDDFCYGGTESFLRETIGKLREKLKVGEQESLRFKYIGVVVEQRESDLILHQWGYVNSIKEPETRRFSSNRVLSSKELTMYRSIVGQLNWLSLHTMPEISFNVSELSKAFKEGTTQDMRKLIKVIRKVKHIRGGVVMGSLDDDGLHWEAYADASFGNVEDGHTQLGYIISLTDGKNRCPIWWKSRKSRRVAKSTIEAEALSVGEAIEGLIYFNHLWEEVVGGRKLDALVKTDSKTLMTAIKSSTGVSSKRLKIDMAAIRETIESGEVKEVQWVQGKHQIADVLTKSGVSEESIRLYVERRENGNDV